MIRQARHEEYDAINELRRQSCAVHGAGRPDRFKPGFPAGHRRRLQAMLDDPARYDVLVWEQEGRLLGYVLQEDVKEPDTAGMYGAHYAHVLELGVDGSARGCGAGRRLMEAAARCAAARGCTEMRLDVWEFNRGAIALYEKLGYATDVRAMSMPLKNLPESP